MHNSDNPAFNELNKQLASGKISFDHAVAACLGTDKNQIATFINDTSIYDLQDHFRAVGDKGKVLLDLSEDVVSIRRGKVAEKNKAVAENSMLRDLAEGLGIADATNTETFEQMGISVINCKVMESPLVDKFFDALKALKMQGAVASEQLVESWIGNDLLKLESTGERRNAIRTRLMMHQFDI